MPRVLIVPFAALSLYVGMAFWFGSPARTMGATYAPAKAVVPAWFPGDKMDAWGALFLAGFVALAWGVVAPPAVTGLTLFIGGGIYFWWATLLTIAFFTEPTASAAAPGVYSFIGFAHFLACWRVYMERKGLVP